MASDEVNVTVQLEDLPQIQAIIDLAVDQTVLLADLYNLVNEEQVGSRAWLLRRDEVCSQVEAVMLKMGIVKADREEATDGN